MSWRLVAGGPSRYFEFVSGARRALYSTKDGADTLIAAHAPVFLKQVHSSTIIDVDASAERIGDGLLSRHKQCLGIRIADCLPVYLFADDRICIIHCGWRGIAAGIARLAKRRLGRYQYVLGASIGPCCYEVGAEVAAQFTARYPDAVQTRDGRRYLDLKTAVTADLGGQHCLGTLDLCTKCHPEYFYSHRAGDRGRNHALIMW